MGTLTTPRAWRGHPVWLVGFRPFFLLACVAGALLPVAWVLVLSGKLVLAPGLSPMAWHAHEMFYGFGFAVLGGFLLTATKNWVQVRGHFGRTLQVLVAAWLFERAGMWFGGTWPVLLRVVSQHLFSAMLVSAVGFTLIRHRKTDTYPDNPLFLVALPA
ncbi:MAG TPA: NnrS family protein, partial [Archangium sp.]